VRFAVIAIVTVTIAVMSLACDNCRIVVDPHRVEGVDEHEAASETSEENENEARHEGRRERRQ